MTEINNEEKAVTEKSALQVKYEGEERRSKMLRGFIDAIQEGFF